MEIYAEKPTKKEQRLAASSHDLLESYLNDLISKSKMDKISLLFSKQTETVEIPIKAFELLIEILSNMAEGKAITFFPVETEITTQQAADLLNVSRPHVIKLLDTEELPYKKVGTHRRIKMQDLMKYKEKLEEKRNKSFEFLAEQAQNLNLGY